MAARFALALLRRVPVEPETAAGSRAERHVPGGRAPRSAALPRPEQNARAVTRLIPWFSSVVSPAVAVMSAVGSVVLRVIRIEPAGSLDLTHSTERMRMAVASREMRLGEHAARTLVDRALRFPEVKARHAMIPRPEIVSVPIAASLDDALATTARCGHSRLPVYEEDLDHIVGVLVVKQILPLFVRDRAAITTGAARRSFQTAALMSDVFAGPETAPVASPLPQLRRDPFAVAIVIDEYGGVAGRITRADVVDSLLDEALTAPEIEEARLTALPHDGSYALDGLMTLTEAKEVYDLPLGENADVETVGGFVFSQLGRQPSATMRRWRRRDSGCESCSSTGCAWRGSGSFPRTLNWRFRRPSARGE